MIQRQPFFYHDHHSIFHEHVWTTIRPCTFDLTTIRAGFLDFDFEDTMLFCSFASSTAFLISTVWHGTYEVVSSQYSITKFRFVYQLADWFRKRSEAVVTEFPAAQSVWIQRVERLVQSLQFVQHIEEANRFRYAASQRIRIEIATAHRQSVLSTSCCAATVQR